MHAAAFNRREFTAIALNFYTHDTASGRLAWIKRETDARDLREASCAVFDQGDAIFECDDHVCAC